MTWINIRGIETCALLQKDGDAADRAGRNHADHRSLFNGESAHMEPLFVGGVGGIMAVLIMTPFMFVGFDVIPQAAEEINLPHNQIGRILIISVLMAVAWYILIILAVALAMPAADSAASNLATADAMTAVFGGSWAGKLLVWPGSAASSPVGTPFSSAARARSMPWPMPRCCRLSWASCTRSTTRRSTPS